MMGTEVDGRTRLSTKAKERHRVGVIVSPFYLDEKRAFLRSAVSLGRPNGWAFPIRYVYKG
jgi:hypothetical protein